MKKNKLLNKYKVLFALSSSLPIFAAAATLQPIYIDPANTGFNDPTLGTARKATLNAALTIWGNQLRSNQVIKVAASYETLPCSGGGARLASAEPTNYYDDFANAPANNRLFPVALAEAISRQNLNSSNNEIVLAINDGVDQGCVNGITGFDYNNNPSTPTAANKIRALPVMLHEIAHGLGFFSPICLVNIPGGCSTKTLTWNYGDYPDGVKDRWSDFLRDGPSGSFWNSLSANARITSARSGNLVWDGPRVNAALASFNLNAAALSGNRIRMHSPNVLSAASSVNHFTADATPNLLMEPDHVPTSAIDQLDLAPYLLADIGWSLMSDPLPTVTTITSDAPDPSDSGQTYSVAVAVSALDGAPSGVVTVRDGPETNAATCQVTLNAQGVGSCLMTSIIRGTRTLTATYPASATFLGSSDTETHTVTAAPTTTLITSDAPDPSLTGESYTVAVTVNSAAGVPTGTVTVQDGAGASCQLNLSGGAGSCALTSTVQGNRILTANYIANPAFEGSSDTEAHVVNQAPPPAVPNFRADTTTPAGTLGCFYGLQWDATATATEYRIEETCPTGQITEILPDYRLYKRTQLPDHSVCGSDGTYHSKYRIQACNGNVCGPWSALISHMPLIIRCSYSD